MRPPSSILSFLTREWLAEMSAPTYADLRDVDVPEAFTRLGKSLRSLSVIEAVQAAVWRGLQDAQPELDDAKLVAKVAKKREKSRRFRGPKRRRADDEGAWIAMAVWFDVAANLASGEAEALVTSDKGRQLVQAGLRLLGAHVATEILR